jgi:hypothetical protein
MSWPRPLHVLVLGASYGLLPAVRVALAGHLVSVVGRPTECEALVARGATIDLAARPGLPGVSGRRLQAPAISGPSQRPGELGMVGTDVDPRGCDIVLLAMSEPQCAASDVAALLRRVAQAALPLVSLINLLPPPFLSRLGTLDVAALRPAWAAWDVWQDLDPMRLTAASPDAQALRLDPTRPDVLTVTLPSNFKVAPFALEADQALLRTLAADLKAYKPDRVPLHARLIAHPALHVPLAKWPMLVTGNCRSWRAEGEVVSIARAVADDLAASRRLYDWASEVVRAAGAATDDLVPFDTYAEAARSLSMPSALARALAAGQPRVERVDLQVQLAARALGHVLPEMDELVARVSLALQRNQPQGRSADPARG